MSKAERAKHHVLPGLCLLALVVAAFVTIVTSTSGLLDPRYLSWPSVQGKFKDIQASANFFALYRYEYQVNGKTFQQTQLLPRAYENTLKTGQGVSVHYKSDSPQESVFDPGFNSTIVFLVLFTDLLSVFFLAVIVLARTSEFIRSTPNNKS